MCGVFTDSLQSSANPRKFFFYEVSQGSCIRRPSRDRTVCAARSHKFAEPNALDLLSPSGTFCRYILTTTDILYDPPSMSKTGNAGHVLHLASQQGTIRTHDLADHQILRTALSRPLQNVMSPYMESVE